MTSKPASRSARATTLAPRSWPSRPGLAINTRSGADSLDTFGDFSYRTDFGDWLQQLDQHTERSSGLQERDFAVCARSRRFVDELDTFVFEIAQVFADVGGAETQVVQAGAAAL